MDKQVYEVVFCIVNAGYSEAVMDSARSAGASGGTVMRAQGTADKEAETLFNLTIQPEKEIVMMLVPKDIKDAVLHALYHDVGLETEGNGIAFTLPVDNVVGLGRKPRIPARKKAEKTEKRPDAEPAQEKAEQPKEE